MLIFSAMRSLVLFFIILILSLNSSAQTCYSARYKYNVDNHFSDAANNLTTDSLLRNGGEVKFRSTFDSILTKSKNVNDSLLTEYSRQSFKYLHDKIFMICESCPQYKKHYIEDEKHPKNYVINDSTKITFHSGFTGGSYIDMATFLKTVISKAGNSFYESAIDTACYLIDTSQVHFNSTGNKIKIGKYYCEEYRPVLNRYKFSIWATNQLPVYVTPSVFGIGINGGIVKVSFDNGNNISLVSLSVLNEIQNIDNACERGPSRKTNIMLHGLADMH